MLPHCSLKVNPGVPIREVQSHRHCTERQRDGVGRVAFVDFPYSCLSEELDVVSAAITDT